MARETWETLVAYKLVWLRAILLIYVPMATFFTSYTEKWTQEHWTEITGLTLKLELFRLVVLLTLAGSGPFIAFFDQSYGRAKSDLERKRSNGGTGFLNRSDTGP